MEISKQEAKRKNRKSMLLLFAMFSVPILFAWFLLGPGKDWLPSGVTNNGTLVVPVRPLPVERQLVGPDGALLADGYLRGKWTLVHMAADRCDQDCVEILNRTKQIRLAMGEDIQRVQRLLLFTGEDLSEPNRLLAEDPNLTIAVTTYAAAAEMLSLFVVDDTSPERSQRVYLVDPLGNLMMYYEPTDRPNGILMDLRKLLKWSQIG